MAVRTLVVWCPVSEARAFEPVIPTVEKFSPRVEVRQLGECAFATSGPSRYFGGDEALAAQVAKAVAVVLAEGSCPGWGVGVADGPFAAGLAARIGVVVPPGRNASFLAPLPVHVLGRPDLTGLLASLGIRFLSQFAALTEEDVLARFGLEGARAQRLARGLDEQPLASRTQPADIVVSFELDPPALRTDTVAFVARSLAQELHERLQKSGLVCTRVRIETETEHGERLSRLWGHAGPFGSSDLAERVRWQLDGWLGGSTGDSGDGGDEEGSGKNSEQPTAGISKLSLAADEVAPDGAGQLGFWGGVVGLDERSSRVLARLQGLLGHESVTTAVVGGGRGPADRVTQVPWGEQVWGTSRSGPAKTARTGRGKQSDQVPPWPGRVPMPSPAVVHAEPLPAELVDAGGRPVRVSARGLLSGRPACLSICGRRSEKVIAWAGPWPAGERWWDSTSRSRKARIQVLLAGGRAHLMVLEAERWMTEATYD